MDNKKPLIAAVLLILTTLPALAQKQATKLTVVQQESSAGRNLLSGTDIASRTYVFPVRIEDYAIDSAANTCTVEMRGTGKTGRWLSNRGSLLIYDLNAQKPLWSQKINYHTGYFSNTNGVIIRNSGNKSSRLNNSTGTQQWQTKVNLIYANSHSGIGFGYPQISNSDNHHKIEGINLTSGSPVWKRHINRDYGWNALHHLNDSTLLIAAAGLHTLNLRTGKGWSYHAVTGAKDYTSTVLTNAAGITLGLLTGSFFFATGSDMVTGIVSNVLIDSSGYYLASKDRVACIQPNGTPLWQVNIPKGFASKSTILAHQQHLVVVNKGYGHMGVRPVPAGKPYLAAYHRQTGEQLFFMPLQEKGLLIMDAEIRNGRLYTVSSDKVSAYSLATGALETSFEIKPETHGAIMGFIGDQVYCQTSTGYQQLTASDSTRLYIYTNTGKTVVLNQGLQKVEELETKALYSNMLQSEEYRFLSRDNETVVLNKNNQAVAILNMAGRATIAGNRLYQASDRQLVVIDMSSFTSN